MVEVHTGGRGGQDGANTNEPVLETGKVRKLRKALRSRSNSEAVRRLIDERLAAEAGLEALRELQRQGGLEDVFGRAAAKKT